MLAVLTGGDVIVLPALAGSVLVMVAGAVGTLEVRRRNELLFLQNLGVSRAVIAIPWMGVAVVLEVSLAVALASLGYAP